MKTNNLPIILGLMLPKQAEAWYYYYYYYYYYFYYYSTADLRSRSYTAVYIAIIASVLCYVLIIVVVVVCPSRSLVGLYRQERQPPQRQPDDRRYFRLASKLQTCYYFVSSILGSSSTDYSVSD